MLALLLAQRGLAVALVDHDRAHYSGPYETVLAATRTKWQRIGLLARIEARAEDLPGSRLHGGLVVDPLQHGAIWGQPELLWRDGEEPGLLLRRGAFDRMLRAIAADAGALVFEAATATRQGDGWLVVSRSAPLAPRWLQAKRMVYATGRARLPELATGIAHGPETIAVTVVGEPALADRGTAIVEAVRDGWIWSHIPTAGPASAAVLMDRQQLLGRDTVGVLTEVFRAAHGPSQRLRDWRIRCANDATQRRRCNGGDSLVIGDAAASIDPLASQGVEKAIAAAEHAALVVATSLQQPHWWPRLLAMHELWEFGLQAAHQRAASSFYRLEQRFVGSRFWQVRQRTLPAGEQLATDATVNKLALAASVQLAPALLRHGDRIIEVDGAVDTTTGAELARIGRVSVVPLLALFAEPSSLNDAVVRAGQSPRLYVLTPQEVHEAILQLLARGWLQRASD